MYKRLTILAVLAVVSLFITTGCATNGESAGGWIVIDRPERTPPPPQKTKPPVTANNNKGAEQAAQNHLRSAYRFLEKNKPSHALKELEKARDKLEGDFRVYYYMGGAYYFQGRYENALDSWQTARRYTKNNRSRSRLRTCQAYALFYLEGNNGSSAFLRRAIDLDDENHHAWELLRSFEDPVSDKKSTKPGAGNDSKHKSRSETIKRSRYAEKMIWGGESKDHGDDKKDKNKNDDDYGNWEDRAKEKKKHDKNQKNKKAYVDIGNQEQFREYFLIEMF